MSLAYILLKVLLDVIGFLMFYIVILLARIQVEAIIFSIVPIVYFLILFYISLIGYIL